MQIGWGRRLGLRHDPSATRPDAPKCGAQEKSRAAPVGMTMCGKAMRIGRHTSTREG